ncbi:MAG: prenyltransferase/squalene oxidase repeat-containing protein, partial [Pirellulales bacterium]
PEQIHWDIYSSGLTMMLLVAVDPSKYRQDVEAIAKSLYLRQKADGAWGYPTGDLAKTCDTSQTQYAVLGLWEAQEFAGVETPVEIWEKIAEWLLKTQDPLGSFAYQGHPSDEIGERITQPGASNNMTAAAMGPLYLVKDRLGIRKLKKRADDGLPTALEPYESPDDIKNRIKTKIELKYFTRAIASGNKWFDKKVPLGKPDAPFIFYYLYARERYESLKEADERDGRKPREDDSPDWYSEGARWLIDNQAENGSWKGTAGEVPDTCFATLFLLRSTQKTLEKAGLLRHQAGLAVGGRGLPKGDNVRVRDGLVVVKPLDGSLNDTMPALLDSQHEEHAQARENLADLARSGERQQLLEQARPLARLAMYGGRDVRVHAILGIRRSRNLDLVPLLIHLLNDGDPEVVRAASDGLGQISRKYTSFGLGLQPTPEQREKAVAQWRKWFHGVRPEVDLNSYDPREAL